VKHVPIAKASPSSRKEMFNTYCAVCHEKGANGSGPAASAMKTPPADLTALTKNSGAGFRTAPPSSVADGRSKLSMFNGLLAHWPPGQ
jgi:mono/diheme cytochrome c family protein